MYLEARLRGASFKRTMTLGHLTLYLHRSEVDSLREQFVEKFGRSPESLAVYQWGDFADRFMEDFLGVEELTVVDASAYQGAETIHDMNHPVPEAWSNRFDVIIDGGTLEHIFNVPVALSSLARMLSVGGTLFISTPANNLMGHGFYQFSPELMFRVFSEENGFALENISLWEASFPSVELSRNRHHYTVADPQRVHQRVGLVSKRPVIMMVEAVKVADIPMFATPPVQSDYAAAWAPLNHPTPEKSLLRKVASGVLRQLPPSVARHVIGRYQKRQFSFSNNLFFTPIHRTKHD